MIAWIEGTIFLMVQGDLCADRFCFLAQRLQARPPRGGRSGRARSADGRPGAPLPAHGRLGRLLRDRERPPRRDRPQPGRRPAGEVPYEWWRDYDPEDALRFDALRLCEVDMIKSDPDRITAGGTDWRFLNELERELKA